MTSKIYSEIDFYLDKALYNSNNRFAYHYEQHEFKFLNFIITENKEFNKYMLERCIKYFFDMDKIDQYFDNDDGINEQYPVDENNFIRSLFKHIDLYPSEESFEVNKNIESKEVNKNIESVEEMENIEEMEEIEETEEDEETKEEQAINSESIEKNSLNWRNIMNNSIAKVSDLVLKNSRIGNYVIFIKKKAYIKRKIIIIDQYDLKELREQIQMIIDVAALYRRGEQSEQYKDMKYRYYSYI